MTTEKPFSKGEGKTFYGEREVLMAVESGVITYQSMINVRINGKRYRTTPGRILIWQVTPVILGFDAINTQFKKSNIPDLLDKSYRIAGAKATVIFADKLKDLGYKYSTIAAYSISIADIKVPEEKWEIIHETERLVREIEDNYYNGKISRGERYNQIVDLWDKANEKVTRKMLDLLEEKEVMHPLWGKVTIPSDNPVYIMQDSGARGSKDQIRQLGGMRGLMAKPSGEIIETPIIANFKEGLDSLDYFISTHGARKGSADTALKTANSGYLTRRLVDVAQDVVVVEDDCGTTIGIEAEALLNDSGEVISYLRERILGRVALDDIENPETGDILIEAGEMIDEEKADMIVNLGIDKIYIRSALTCRSKYGVCARCYGRDLSRGHIINVGEATGIIAAQSIGEPGTQLTMRTFHIGGAASRTIEKSSHEAKRAGIVKLKDIKLLPKNVDNPELAKLEGSHVVMNRNGKIIICDEKGREREKYPVNYGTNLFVKEGDSVGRNQVLAEWDPYNTPIIAETDGTVRWEDIENGVTVREDLDSQTGLSKTVVINTRDPKKSPKIIITEQGKKKAKRIERGEAIYHLPTNAYIELKNGEEIKAGAVLSKVPREARKTKDITGGLPRISDLFEARKSKNPAIVAEISGFISTSEEGKGLKNKRLITVTPEIGEPRAHIVPKEKHLNVHDGDWIEAGEPLIDGSVDPHDVLRIKGETAVANFLVEEVQKVYKLQGVPINDKHIEVIVKQMLRKVKIVDSGDTVFLKGELVEKERLIEVNATVERDGKKPAQWETVLLGITKASLNTESFISAASFQETTKVLTNAAIEKKEDKLRGLKENIIIGKKIPAGTGYPLYNEKNFEVEIVSEHYVNEDDEEDLIQEENAIPN